MSKLHFRGRPMAAFLARTTLLCSLALVAEGGLPIAVGVAAAQPLPNSGRDFDDANAYRLTMPKVRAFARARDALASLEGRDEAAAEALCDCGHDIASDVANMAKHGGVKAIVAKEGLTLREYMLIERSLLRNALPAAVATDKAMRARMIADGVSAANTAFVAKNEAEIKRLLHWGKVSEDEMEPTEDDLAPLVRK